MNLTYVKKYDGNIEVDVVRNLSDPLVCHVGVAGQMPSSGIRKFEGEEKLNITD